MDGEDVSFICYWLFRLSFLILILTISWQTDARRGSSDDELHPTNQDVEPPKKKMPKRKRSFSRSLKRGAPDQKVGTQSAPREEVVSNAREDEVDVVANAKIRASVTTATSSSKRNYTKKDYSTELRKAVTENTELKIEIQALEKKLVSSERKNAHVVEAQRLSQIAARESKRAARDAEAKCQKLEKSLKEAAEAAEVLRQEHEESLRALEEKMLHLLEKKLDAAREKAQVSNFYFQFDGHLLLIINLTSIEIWTGQVW